MSGARKMEAPTEEIKITDEDRARAQALLDSMEFEPIDVEEYRKVLDRYCEEFDASSYYELMSRADMSEFSFEICSQILEYYPIVTKPRSNSL